MIQASYKNLFRILLLILTPVLFFGQQQIALDGRIKKSVLNDNTGILLLKTSEALYGIDPQKNKVLWRNRSNTDLNFDGYTEVPFSPYVFFEDKPLLGSNFLSKTLNTKGVSRAVMDITTGKLLFSSSEQGFEAVFNTIILPEQKAILVDGKKEAGFTIALFDFETGNQLWDTNVSSAFFKTAKGALLNEEKVVLDAYKNVFWLKNRQLLKLNLQNGAIAFEQTGVTSITLTPKGDRLLVASNNVKAKKLNQETLVYALHPKSLDSLWPAPVSIVGNLMATSLEGASLVAITSKGFKIIDTQTGKSKWKRSASLPLIRKIVPIKEGYLVVQENFLTRINAAGRVVWKDKVRVSYATSESPITVFDGTDEALFISPSRVNKVTLDSGKKIWAEDLILFDADYINRNLKLKLPFHQIWYNPKNEQFPVYNGNAFYIFQHTMDTPPKVLYDFDFGRKLPELKIRAEGYFMFLENNFYYFDFTGNLVYKKEYEALKSGSLLQRSFQESFYFLKRGFQVASATVLFAPNQVNQAFRNTIVSNKLGGVGNILSGIYGTYRSYTQGIRNLTDIDLGINSSLSYVFSRLNRERANDDTKIIIIPEEKGSKILRFQIDTGKEEILKEVKSQNRKFVLDEVEQLLYSFKGNTVFIERFN